MIILNLIVSKGGFAINTKSFYCNVGSINQIPGSGMVRIEKEYIQTIRKYAGITEEEFYDEELLDHSGWFYCKDDLEIMLTYSDETEQIWPL